MRQRHRVRRVVFLFAAIAAAQVHTPAIYELGTTPKPKAEDYDAHAKAGELEIGAEFMVHSFSRREEMYIARDYLTVEVALYPAKDPSGKQKPFDVNLGEFWLAVNHETTSMADSPYTVAAELDHPEWQPSPPSPHLEIWVGPPARTPPPAGEPPGYPTTTPLPRPEPPGGVERVARPKPSQVAIECSLPEGRLRSPVSGFLYFSYAGKIKSIKSLALRFRDVELKLR